MKRPPRGLEALPAVPYTSTVIGAWAEDMSKLIRYADLRRQRRARVTHRSTAPTLLN